MIALRPGDARLRSGIALRLVILAPLYGFAAVCAGLMGYAVGPDAEESLAPVIRNQAVERTWRAGDLACWAWTYDKARSATFLGESFVVERDDGIRFPTMIIRPDLGIPTNDSTTAKAGTRRTIPQCAIVPPAMQSTPHFSVHGHKHYRPWHGLWTLDQPIIPVEFGAPSATLAE